MHLSGEIKILQWNGSASGWPEIFLQNRRLFLDKPEVSKSYEEGQDEKLLNLQRKVELKRKMIAQFEKFSHSIHDLIEELCGKKEEEAFDMGSFTILLRNSDSPDYSRSLVKALIVDTSEEGNSFLISFDKDGSIYVEHKGSIGGYYPEQKSLPEKYLNIEEALSKLQVIEQILRKVRNNGAPTPPKPIQ